VRRSGPVFSTPVRPTSVLLSPAASILAGLNPLQEGRCSLSPALDNSIQPQQRHGNTAFLDASVALQNSSHKSSDCGDNTHRLFVNSIVEISKDSDETECSTLSGSPPSIEVEVAEDASSQLLLPRGQHHFRPDHPVAAWRRELRERSEPECLTYLQSRPVVRAQQLLAGSSCRSAAVDQRSSSDQNWIRTLQESGRRVLSTIKAFKR
jgi:hypothetical protein